MSELAVSTATEKATISASRQVIEAELIESAKSYFNTSNIDFYKAGLIGFEIEKLSEMFSDMNLHLAFKSEERFINTAKLHSSVDKIAREFSYVEKYSEPCSIIGIISLQIEDRDKLTNNIEINCDDFFLNSDGIEYCIPGDISIQRNANSNNWFATLNNTNNFDFPTGLLTSDVIRDTNNNENINFIIEFRQMRLSTTTEILPVRNHLVPYNFRVNIINQLVDIKVYRKNSLGEKQYLDRISNFAAETSDLTREVFSLSRSDSNEYMISLGDGSRFKFIPTGVELFIDIFETLGTGGKLFTPTFKVTTKNTLLNRTVFAYSNLNSTSGKDSLSFDKYKQDVLAHIQTPDHKTVVTEFDFNNVLSRTLELDTGDVLTLIRRNDPIKRVTEAFLKITNPVDGTLMYTNTIDLKIVLTDAADISNFNISPKTIIKVAEGTSFGVIIDTAPTSEDLATNDKYYMTNFYTLLRNLPLRQEKYILTLFKNSDILNLEKYIAPNTFFKISSKIKGLTFEKYDDGSADCFFNIDLSSSDRTSLLREIDDNNLLGAIRFSSDVDGYLGHIKLTLNDKDQLSGSFKVLNCFSDGKLEVVDLYTDVTYRELGDSVLFPNEINIELIAYTNSPDNIQDTSIQATGQAGAIYSDWSTLNIPEFSVDSFILFEYNQNSLFQVFSNITNLYSSDLIKTDDLNYTLEKVPLFSYQDSVNTDYNDYFETLPEKIDNTWSLIQDIKEEPTNLSLKYFNTYGATSSYSDNVNYTDLKIEIELSFYNIANTSTDIIDKIKQIVVDHITEKANNHSAIIAKRHIFLSEIITKLKTEVLELEQVRILNFTDNIYFTGELSYKQLTPEELLVYVPNVLNLRADNITLTIL